MWFKVDDTIAFHPKVLNIDESDRMAAMGLWSLVGALCAQQLTDGVISTSMLRLFPDGERLARVLVDAELWVEDARRSDRFRFHDWGEYQPTRSEIRARREAERVRQERYRKRRMRENADENHAVVTRDETRDSRVSHASSKRGDDALPTRPDPTRPDSSIDESERHDSDAVAHIDSAKRSRGTRLPDDWEPSAELVAYAAENMPSIRELPWVVAKFKDHWLAAAGAAGLKRDWDATFRNWLRREHETNVARGWTEPRDTTRDYWTSR